MSHASISGLSHSREAERGAILALLQQSLLHSDTEALAQVWLLIGAHGQRSPDHWGSVHGISFWIQVLSCCICGVAKSKQGWMGGIEKQLMLQRVPSLMKGGHPMLNLSNSVTLNQSGGRSTAPSWPFSLPSSHKVSWWLSQHSTDTQKRIWSQVVGIFFSIGY